MHEHKHPSLAREAPFVLVEGMCSCHSQALPPTEPGRATKLERLGATVIQEFSRWQKYGQHITSQKCSKWDCSTGSGNSSVAPWIPQNVDCMIKKHFGHSEISFHLTLFLLIKALVCQMQDSKIYGVWTKVTRRGQNLFFQNHSNFFRFCPL